MDKKHYLYNGPLIQNNATFLQKWEQEVWAYSGAQAKTFLINRAKSQFGDSYFNIDLSQLRDITPNALSDVYGAPRKQKCDKCGARLTDGGYCPQCDDGAEDLDEALSASERSFIGRFIDMFVDDIDINKNDELFAINPGAFDLPSYDVWEYELGELDSLQIRTLIKCCTPELFKQIAFHYFHFFSKVLGSNVYQVREVRDYIAHNTRLRITQTDLVNLQKQLTNLSINDLFLPLDAATVKNFTFKSSWVLEPNYFDDGVYTYIFNDYSTDNLLNISFDLSIPLDECLTNVVFEDTIAELITYPIQFSNNIADVYVAQWLPFEWQSLGQDAVMAAYIGTSPKREYVLSKDIAQGYVDSGYNLVNMQASVDYVNDLLGYNGFVIEPLTLQVHDEPFYLEHFEIGGTAFPIIDKLYLNSDAPMEESIYLTALVEEYKATTLEHYIKHVYYKNKEITWQQLLDAFRERWGHL